MKEQQFDAKMNTEDKLRKTKSTTETTLINDNTLLDKEETDVPDT